MSSIDRIAALLIGVFRSGGKLLIIGNGGSAADASHIAAEFVGRYRINRMPLPAVALTDAAAITAIGNDFGFEQVFARQVQALGAPGDALLALSTSGRSENVLAAIGAAQTRSMKVIGFTGSPAMADMCDHAMIFEGDTPQVQQGYMAAAHSICEAVEQWAASA